MLVSPPKSAITDTIATTEGIDTILPSPEEQHGAHLLSLERNVGATQTLVVFQFGGWS